MLNISETCWLNETLSFFDQSWSFRSIKANSCMIVFKFWSKNCVIYNMIWKRIFDSIVSYIINWSSHAKRSLHVSMLVINRRTAWLIWSMICSYSLSFSANRIRIRSRIINLMSLITSIGVIATIILEDDFQMIQINHAFHTIEKKIISIEIERWFYTIQKNDVLYARKLIADSAIIFEKSEIFIKSN